MAEATAAAVEMVAARTALVAGATGLVGREILTRLSADKRYSAVHCIGRRPLSPELLKSPRKGCKISSHTVNFADPSNWPPLPSVDEVFIALGTTIAQAGSQAAFRAVDLDAVVAVALAGRVLGATQLGVISAMGANRLSLVFYNRIKGQMEEAVSALGYTTVVLARPSLLAGARTATGQPARRGEKLGLAAMDVFKPLIPVNYRAVAAGDVAQTLIRQVQACSPGQHVLLSGALQGG
jgi:uncharacterized protein YbjT (DUF2867 family)